MHMMTVKRRMVDPFADDFEADIEEIAHALSMMARYNGHCGRFYSVAEHCYHCSMQIEDSIASMAALMHDAAEAYLGDIIRPQKDMHGINIDNRIMPFKATEALVLYNMLNSLKLGQALACVDSAAVKAIDNAVMAAEMKELFDYCIDSIAPANVKLFYWSPGVAKEMFLARYEDLKGDNR